MPQNGEELASLVDRLLSVGEDQRGDVLLELQRARGGPGTGGGAGGGAGSGASNGYQESDAGGGDGGDILHTMGDDATMQARELREALRSLTSDGQAMSNGNIDKIVESLSRAGALSPAREVSKRLPPHRRWPHHAISHYTAPRCTTRLTKTRFIPICSLLSAPGHLFSPKPRHTAPHQDEINRNMNSHQDAAQRAQRTKPRSAKKSPSRAGRAQARRDAERSSSGTKVLRRQAAPASAAAAPNQASPSPFSPRAVSRATMRDAGVPGYHPGEQVSDHAPANGHVN